ncbi:MAG: CRISPR-associated protein Csx19 [Thermodesulfovibrio sp.]|nr:CRISPR-associated protein Csx19 [Thermodesulfovibrio sp.]
MKIEESLKLIKLDSEIKKFDKIENLNNFIENLNEIKEGYVVAYLTYKVLIGKFQDGRLSFYKNQVIEPRFLLKMRIFNKDAETLIWRQNGNLKARTRVDKTGESHYAVIAFQQLWGTKNEVLDQSYSRVFEERGTEIIVPFTNFNLDTGKNRIFVKTINYIDFHPEIYIATYVDCRFAGFFDKNLRELS